MQEALKSANSTVYGLGAGVFTTDLKRAHLFASRLQAGNVWVNTYNDICECICVFRTSF